MPIVRVEKNPVGVTRSATRSSSSARCSNDGEVFPQPVTLRNGFAIVADPEAPGLFTAEALAAWSQFTTPITHHSP